MQILVNKLQKVSHVVSIMYLLLLTNCQYPNIIFGHYRTPLIHD